MITQNTIPNRLSQRVISSQIRNFVEKTPRYNVEPKILRNRRTTRIFNPIPNSNGQYLEISTKEVNGRNITAYRKVSLYSTKNKLQSRAQTDWTYRMTA